jgi:hypothetical protein
MTPAQLIARVRTRAIQLFFSRGWNDEAYTYKDAEQAAAREIKREGVKIELPQAAKPKHHMVQDVRERLVQAFMRLLPEEDTHPGPFEINPAGIAKQSQERSNTNHHQKKSSPIKKVDPPPIPYYATGVFTGNSPTGAIRIDTEFDRRGSFDEVTSNWRTSIRRNQEIEEERRQLWAKRLAEIKKAQAS